MKTEQAIKKRIEGLKKIGSKLSLAEAVAISSGIVSKIKELEWVLEDSKEEQDEK
ncbi:MAG: hypothetical protein ACTSXD_11595 [Candidatus Heimdallarchaeaceae archaeon]